MKRQVYRKLFIVKTDSIGWLYTDNIFQALLFASRCKALGIAADIKRNPFPEAVEA